MLGSVGDALPHSEGERRGTHHEAARGGGGWTPRRGGKEGRPTKGGLRKQLGRRTLLQPIAKLYFVGALLANMKTCITADHPLDGYGNLAALKFLVSPPSLHNYLHS